ncbi:MAG: hypothetical protein HUJ68_07630 [Clostridia bacterium]|nr:hypothetical protein [Clostridia bacterium]
MNLKELKQLESSYFTSEKSNLREYGRAYKDILTKCKRFSGLWLSDQMLISEMAEVYINEQLRESQFVNDKTAYLNRIKGASKLIVHNYATREEVKSLIDNLEIKPETFEEARKTLEKSYLYNKIKPSVLADILSDL